MNTTQKIWYSELDKYGLWKKGSQMEAPLNNKAPSAVIAAMPAERNAANQTAIPSCGRLRNLFGKKIGAMVVTTINHSIASGITNSGAFT